MSTSWGNVPLNATIPFFFDAFDGGTGASITLTGLALADVLIYKGTSMTQRSSTAGIVLLDTDGIDVDLTTGIHGFSIDTSDNTDAGFYAAGSFYTVVVASVTIDAQTVNFVAGTFRLTAAEGVAGVPDVNVTHVGDTAQTAGDIIGDTNDIQTRLPAALVGGRVDASVGAMAADVVTAAAIASGAIDADAIAADAIGASELAADAVTEIQAGLATAAVLGTPAGASIAADIAAIEAQTDDIGVAGAGLTAVPWNAAWDAEAQSEANDALVAFFTSAATLVDLIWDEAMAELAQATPSATPTMRALLSLLYMMARNAVTSTSSSKTFSNDAGTVVFKKALSDDGSTFTEAEMVTGP